MQGYSMINANGFAFIKDFYSSTNHDIISVIFQQNEITFKNHIIIDNSTGSIQKVKMDPEIIRFSLDRLDSTRMAALCLLLTNRYWKTTFKEQKTKMMILTILIFLNMTVRL